MPDLKTKFALGSEVVVDITINEAFILFSKNHPYEKAMELARNRSIGKVVGTKWINDGEQKKCIYSILYNLDEGHVYEFPEDILRPKYLKSSMDRFEVRAMDKKTHEWITGYPAEHFGVPSILTPMQTYQAIDSSTLCSKTGFVINQKPIWENDIVEVVWNSGSVERYLLWWNREMSMMSAVSLEGIQFNGHDYWNSPHPTYEDFALMMQDPWGDIKSVEVVGNLFDNPELLHNKEEEKDER